MPELVALIKWEVAIFLFVLASLVATQLLSGQINVAGLLYGRISGREKGRDKYFSPERVQLLVLTLGAALYYLSQVLSSPDPGTLPTVPTSWVSVLGGSNAVYLTGKGYARWFATGRSK